MKVLKFGGTSVGSSENIHKVVNIIAKASQTTKVAIIVSAVGGITDQLLKAAQLACLKDNTYQNVLADITSQHSQIVKDLFHSNEMLHLAVSKVILKELSELKRLLDGIFLIEEVSPKTKDKLLSFGEIIASRIIYNALNNKGLKTEFKNSQELIITDSNFTHANVDFELTNLNIILYFNSNVADITVIPGFIAKSVTHDETTLGRGGSDYSAAIIAAAIDASELQIWTDVSGMYTANPKLVKQASPIESLSYQEAIELSHFGAKVLFPPTVMPVLNKHIPIVIKNTLKPEATGTCISDVQYGKSQSPVKGLSNIDHIALLTLQGNGMIGVPGYSKRLFEALAQEKINVIFITQSSSEHSICFGIADTDANKAKFTIDNVFEYEIASKRLDPVMVETELSIIALVGDRMKSHQGISGKMFSALGKNNVNIRAIAQGASERNISAVIHKDNVKKALNVLHERFFEVKTKANQFIYYRSWQCR